MIDNIKLSTGAHIDLFRTIPPFAGKCFFRVQASKRRLAERELAQGRVTLSRMKRFDEAVMGWMS